MHRQYRSSNNMTQQLNRFHLQERKASVAQRVAGEEDKRVLKNLAYLELRGNRQCVGGKHDVMCVHSNIHMSFTQRKERQNRDTSSWLLP